MNNTCAVVLTHNRKEKLKKCIEALQSQKGASCDLLIVDNDSSDGTEAMVASINTNDSIHYLNTGRNLGSAGGFSYGVKQAVMRGYEYLWIMDDDVYPDDNSLEQLLAASEKLGKTWGCLSSYSYWKDGTICKANRQKKGIFTFVKDEEYLQELIPVKIVSFASMFVKSAAVKKVGLPIAEYFFYTDDYEFSSRISQEYSTYVVTASKVLHDMDNNIKADIVKDPPEKMYRYKTLYRNDMHFYKKFGLKGYAYLFLKFCYTLLNILVTAKNNKKEKVKILVEGYKDGMSFSPMIEKI